MSAALRTFLRAAGIPLLLFLVAANLFTIGFMSREQAFYYFDTGFHWVQTVNLAADLSRHPLQALRSVIYTVRHYEYSDLGPLLLTPFVLVGGPSRTAYILAVVNLFAFPAAITSLLLFRKLAAKTGAVPGMAGYLLPVFFIAAFPLFWSPTLSGYLDVGGLVLLNLVLLACSGADAARQRMGALVFMAACLCAVVLFRRWYAFWVVGFFLAWGLDLLVFAFPAGPEKRREFLRGARNGILLGLLTAALFFGLAWPLALQILRTDYSDIYAAYRISEGFLGAVTLNLVNGFGLFYLLLFLGGAAWLMRRPALRRFTFFLLAQWALTFLLFIHTQDFTVHHLYLLQPAMLLVCSLFLWDAARAMPDVRWKAATILAYVLIALFSWAVFFVPKCESFARWCGPCCSQGHLYPRVRHDRAEIGRLLEFLAARATGAEDRIYVLAVSDVLNDDLLRFAYLSIERPKTVEDKILITHCVDKRDGFPSNMLGARFLVVADPVQTHMRPEDQRVVSVPAELVLRREGIGAAYDRLPEEFDLDGGVKAVVLERIRPFAEADIHALSETFRAFYPDRPALYEIQQR